MITLRMENTIWYDDYKNEKQKQKKIGTLEGEESRKRGQC